MGKASSASPMKTIHVGLLWHSIDSANLGVVAWIPNS